MIKIGEASQVQTRYQKKKQYLSKKGKKLRLRCYIELSYATISYSNQIIVLFLLLSYAVYEQNVDNYEETKNNTQKGMKNKLCSVQ